MVCPLSGPVLRDTARLSQRYPPSPRATGFVVSPHGQLGAIPPPPFLSVSPLQSIREVEVRYPPPPQKGYLSDACAIPYENKANGCDTPLCDTISKRYCAIWGGISHWAAKFVLLVVYSCCLPCFFLLLSPFLPLLGSPLPPLFLLLRPPPPSCPSLMCMPLLLICCAGLLALSVLLLPPFCVLFLFKFVVLMASCPPPFFPLSLLSLLLSSLLVLSPPPHTSKTQRKPLESE